jgi:TRAP-type C4-dicarboxylate transport system permease small subunit
MKQVKKLSLAVLDAFVAIPILFGIALNFANVVGRYVFGTTIIWADEVLIYIIAWIVFYGAGLVSLRGRHLSIDLLSTALSKRAKILLRVATLTLTVMVCLFVLYSSTEMLGVLGRSGQKSIAAGIPMVIPHSAIPLGFAIMVIAGLSALARKSTYQELDKSKQ